MAKTFFKVLGENRAVFNDEHFSRKPRRRGVPVDDVENIPPMTHRFRVCDDDGTAYFWGVCSSDSSFHPLDYLGVDYGCTYIEYKNPVTGKYEAL